MPLFQNSVLNKYLKALDTEKVAVAYDTFTKHFHSASIQENIRNSKEEQYQEGFLRDLFVTIFGYILNPETNFNLTTELKNIKGSKKTDGAILKGEKALAVIELKGTNTTDLSKVETQAFGYKNNQPGCNYVITSNFEKLRFYIDNAVDFEEFNLFQLTKERFDLLWLCLSSDYLLKDIPKKIKDESLTQEENVTKKLYKDYASFRNEIFDAIQNENPEYDKLTLFKKTQKLLDRFLFIFFAEDRLLLPPNSIRVILKQWKTLKDELDAYVPLYDRFKKYFGYMNTGHKGKQYDIFAYNGGLFAADDILDNIKINDDLLYKHTLNLSNYDFESEVSVNILGHIFEHSLNDIDEIQAELSMEHAPLALDKSKTKRKKDGVFYTPKYITKYIVDNTVGKLCEEKKTELDIRDADYEKERKGRQKATLKKLTQKLEDYRTWLLQITICDPACGSSAFLNQALEFLIAEHQYIDELQAKLFGDAMVLSEVENSILENNLFGVDINEESVEIAKLSLWLRTAQKGRKLTSLNDNIKCGNSLIDDPTVAGDKAFHWQNEFPDIFKEKDKKAYHITTAIHDSRTSARMKKYKVREHRDGGTNPYPNVIYFTKEDDLLITQTIADIVKEDQLNLMAYNICADHIHLLLVCEIEQIPAIMQKIKSITAKKVNTSREHAPLGKPLWSQKYSAPKEVTTQVQLDNTLRYIQNNRNKHELPAHPKKLQRIIDDMCCSVEKAFTPEYTGGFDVVIGNPPWGAKLEKQEEDFLLKKYPIVPSKLKDSYMYFMLLCIDILKPSSYYGQIIPNTWLLINNTADFRRHLLGFEIIEIVDHGDGIFQDAIVESSSIFLKKNIEEDGKVIAKKFQKGKERINHIIEKKYWLEDELARIVLELKAVDYSLIKKLESVSDRFDVSSEIIFGIKPYQVGHGKPPQTRDMLKNRIFHSKVRIDDTWKPLVTGTNVNKYLCEYDNDAYIKYGEWLMYPSNQLKIEGKKILLRRTSADLRSVVDQNTYYPQNSLFIITSNYKLEYLTALLNSKLFDRIYKAKCPQVGKVFAEVKPSIIKSLPIINPGEKIENEISELVLSIQNKWSEFASIRKQLTNLLRAKISLEKLTKKLQNWHDLDFGEFLKELEKARKKAVKTTSTEHAPLAYKKLSLSEEAEWMQYFNEQKQKATALKAQIDKTDKEIDAMVYELYGLTDDEIAIVEEATK